MSCTCCFVEPPGSKKSLRDSLRGVPYDYSHGCVEPVRYDTANGLDTKPATGVRACRDRLSAESRRMSRRDSKATDMRQPRAQGPSALETVPAGGIGLQLRAQSVKLADLLKVAVGFEVVDGRHVRSYTRRRVPYSTITSSTRPATSGKILSTALRPTRAS